MPYPLGHGAYSDAVTMDFFSPRELHFQRSHRHLDLGTRLRLPRDAGGLSEFQNAYSLQARLAQSAERKALNLVVVGSSPTVGVFRRPERPFALQETRTTEAATLLAELSRRHSDQNSQDSLTEWLR